MVTEGHSIYRKCTGPASRGRPGRFYLCSEDAAGQRDRFICMGPGSGVVLFPTHTHLSAAGAGMVMKPSRVRMAVRRLFL